MFSECFASMKKCVVPYVLAIHALPLSMSVIVALLYNLFISSSKTVTCTLIIAGVLGVIYIFYLQPLRKLCAINGGSYKVGIREICGNLENGHAPITVYYPVQAQTQTEKRANATTNWLPFNDTRYLDGLSAYSHVPRILLNDLAFVKINALKEAPLISLFDEITNEVRPIIVFSHGLAGFAQIYSTLLMTMASRGAIVFALTHMDASAAFCRDAQTESAIDNQQHLWESEKERVESVCNKKYQERLEQQHIEAQQSKPNNTQTSHSLHIAFNAALKSTVQDRRSQLIQRTSELSSAVERVLNGELLVKIGVSNNEVNRFITFKKPISLMGHSFGGASVMASLLHKHGNFVTNSSSGLVQQSTQIVTTSLSCEARKRIAAAVVLDPWHVMLNSELFLELLKRNSATYTTPTLTLETEEWMRISENKQLVHYLETYSDNNSFVEQSCNTEPGAKEKAGNHVFTIEQFEGTAHRTCTDVALLNPILNEQRYATVEPATQIASWVERSLQFIAQCYK